MYELTTSSKPEGTGFAFQPEHEPATVSQAQRLRGRPPPGPSRVLVALCLAGLLLTTGGTGTSDRTRAARVSARQEVAAHDS